MELLCSDVLVEIFWYLPYDSLFASIRFVCRQFHEILNNPELDRQLWGPIAERIGLEVSNVQDETQSGFVYRQFVLRKYLRNAFAEGLRRGGPLYSGSKRTFLKLPSFRVVTPPNLGTNPNLLCCRGGLCCGVSSNLSELVVFWLTKKVGAEDARSFGRARLFSNTPSRILLRWCGAALGLCHDWYVALVLFERCIGLYYCGKWKERGSVRIQPGSLVVIPWKKFDGQFLCVNLLVQSTLRLSDSDSIEEPKPGSPSSGFEILIGALNSAGVLHVWSVSELPRVLLPMPRRQRSGASRHSRSTTSSEMRRMLTTSFVEATSQKATSMTVAVHRGRSSLRSCALLVIDDSWFVCGCQRRLAIVDLKKTRRPREQLRIAASLEVAEADSAIWSLRSIRPEDDLVRSSAFRGSSVLIAVCLDTGRVVVISWNGMRGRVLGKIFMRGLGDSGNPQMVDFCLHWNARVSLLGERDFRHALFVGSRCPRMCAIVKDPVVPFRRRDRILHSLPPNSRGSGLLAIEDLVLLAMEDRILVLEVSAPIGRVKVLSCLMCSARRRKPFVEEVPSTMKKKARILKVAVDDGSVIVFLIREDCAASQRDSSPFRGRSGLETVGFRFVL